MQPTLLQLIAQSWGVPFWPTFSALVIGAIYIRGWRQARTTRPRELPLWRAVCFFGGLFTMWFALASPIDALDNFLLVAHMTQHLLLVFLAPPLLLLGCPVVPLLRGLPRSFVRNELAPWINSGGFRFLQRLFTRPAFGWLAITGTIVFWHMPFAYELTLRSTFWHDCEHGCFFFAALAFWWYVLRPWPSHIRVTRWLLVPYIVTAHLVLLEVATVIALSRSVIYPSYAGVPRLFGLSALTDQGMAGGEMAFVGMITLVVTLFPLLVQLISEQEDRPPRENSVVWVRLPWARPRRPATFSRTAVVATVPSWRYRRAANYGIAIALVSTVSIFSLHTGDSGDDARLRFRQPSGPFILSLFTPNPIREGESDFSVAVERPDGEGLIPDADVELRLTPITGGEPVSVHAAHADASPKFLQAASVTLPQSGNWRIGLVARRGSKVAEYSTQLQVLPANSTLPSERIWDAAALALVFVFFGLHHWRKRVYMRDRRNHAEPALRAAA